MSRKDYILIAETIKALTSFTTTNPACDDAVRFSVIVNQFADALAGTNPRFNRSKFVAACNGKAAR
jgi:hypothetical protein